jgi:bifunctional DNA-binding transcriptional regulator/antitoxin component of YhaV-PrlF toxin-antitoxin module
MKHFGKLTKHNRLTLPKWVLNEASIKTGDSLRYTVEEDSIVVTRVATFDEVAGSLHKYAIKGKSIEEVMEMEERAIEDGYSEGYINKLK